jgi:RNA polymerase sigma-70 factor (ECF subfamily)
VSWDLNDLFKRHARDIARSLRRRGMNAETAADITQDTFLRVLTSPPAEGTAAHNPVAYLYRVSRNLSIDHHRREKRQAHVDLTDDDFAAIVDPNPSPEAAVYHRERLALTEAALAELPQRTREAFELHRLGELTIADVAARLGLSTSRTWMLIRDAYEQIDTRLNGV